MDNKKSTGRTAFESLIIIAAFWLSALFIWKNLENAALVFPAAFCGSVLVLFSWRSPTRFKTAISWCFRFRWLLALLLFCLCVCLRIHGSSVGVYDEVLPTQTAEEETTLFGISRGVRSDEFGVQTPTAFSQYGNQYKLYSNQMSISDTNMVLDYYSPVKDLTAIGKPLMWGYLLFGNEIGLSWYWCGIEILLFMTALEMCLILTRKARLVSFLGGTMIALSPEIQWWVLPHMPIVILYAMGLFCIGYSFFTVNTTFWKWFYALLACIAVIGFALSIFPAFQVPCVYIILALLTGCLWRDRDSITFTRREWYRIAVPLLTAGAILFRFFYLSLDDFDLLLNTVYPGRRVSTGGIWSVSALFTDISSFFLPYKDITYANNCEVSTYLHFAPFFLLMMPRINIYLKEKPNSNLVVGKTLFGILIVEIIFMLVGFPRFLAEITLFRFCNRMDSIYDWTAVIYTVWGISVLLQYPEILSKKEKVLYPIGYGVFCSFLIDVNLRNYFAQYRFHGYLWFGNVLIVLALMAFVIILLLAAFRRKRLMAATIVSLMLFSGATVNPIEKGVGAIYNHPISRTISEIAQQEPESRWLCADCSFLLSNYTMANGVKVLSATNFYPDLDKWVILDPDGKYEDVYNRYANQTATIGEEESSVELIQADLLSMKLNPEAIKEMEIQYLLSAVDYRELLSKYDVDCEYIDGQDGYNIYRLSY